MANILFILSGSIAGYKACEVVSKLTQDGHRLRVVATASALHFVGAATLEGLTGEAVLSDLFESGRALEHIHLARWADATVVCPATANSLNRFAAGLADDLAGALFLAHDRTKPLLFAPAMNPTMWAHPTTQASVTKLQGWGLRFIPVGRGHTACGEEGEGRMAEPATIVAAIEAALAKPARRLRVLITSGGTAEPIDGVRFLSNFSTGRTGAGLAAHFLRRGHEVVLLRGRDSAPAPPGCQEEVFFTFSDLDAALTRLLGGQSFDAILHAAAVSDFRVGAVIVGGMGRPPQAAKLDSRTPPLLKLEPNPKVVETLRTRSRHSAVQIVAFKLTQGAPPEVARSAIAGLFAAAGADLVVYNDLTERGASPDAFPAEIHLPHDPRAIPCATRSELAVALERLLAGTPLQA